MVPVPVTAVTEGRLWTFIFAAAAAVAMQGGAIGSFRHGQWQGECYRDGYLAGMDDELCRVRWTGNMDLWFEHDAKHLTLFLAVADRSSSRCSANSTISAARLKRPRRDTEILDAIHALARTLARQCRSRVKLTAVKLRDLRATLRETDDLTHLSR